MGLFAPWFLAGLAGLALEIVKAEKAGNAPVTSSPTRGVVHREELGARLAELSDEEMEALLAIRAKRREQRVTEEF